MEDLSQIVAEHLAKTASARSTRRRHERFQPQSPLFARLGRSAVHIVDLSLGGARVEHLVAIHRDSHPRLRFTWAGEEFDEPAHVLSSRLVSITDRRRIITRIFFPNLSDQSRALLTRIVDALNEERIARWTANLHGTNPPVLPRDPVATRWIAYSQVNGRWEGRLFKGESLPNTGFVVPDTIPPAEVREICDVFPQLTDDGRELLRRCLVAAGGTATYRPVA